MRPTKGGVAACALGAALYGLAWVTHLGWFYIADALVWAIVLVNVPLPWLSLRAYSAQRRVLEHISSIPANPEGVFEEDAISLAIELHNQSFFPQFLVTLIEHCPLAPPDETARGFLIAGLAPKKRITLSYQTRC